MFHMGEISQGELKRQGFSVVLPPEDTAELEKAAEGIDLLLDGDDDFWSFVDADDISLCSIERDEIEQLALLEASLNNRVQSLTATARLLDVRSAAGQPLDMDDPDWLDFSAKFRTMLEFDFPCMSMEQQTQTLAAMRVVTGAMARHAKPVPMNHTRHPKRRLVFVG